MVDLQYSFPLFGKIIDIITFFECVTVKVSCCLLASGVSLDRREAQARCPACSDRSAYKEITKKTIKAEILRKLGFSSAPNVTGEDFSSLPVVKKQIEEVNVCFIIIVFITFLELGGGKYLIDL